MPSNSRTPGPWVHPDLNPWGNDAHTLGVYRKRCRRELPEMTCASQAASILSGLVSPGETLLDAGCGGGYYYWSFAGQGLPVEYWGLDYTPAMIELAREEMCPRTGLSPDRFMLGAIECLEHDFDTVVCFNVLTNSPHYGLPLSALTARAKKRILLRESMADEFLTRFTPDPHLDEGKHHIRVYHNVYPVHEVRAFLEEEGFRVTQHLDQRTNGLPEMVVGQPHYWKILLAERMEA